MKSPYDILGVATTASPAEIRSAYRRLAKKSHPDVNPGKADAAAAFGAISSANALLSDPEKRARFDRGALAEEIAPKAAAASALPGLTSGWLFFASRR